MRIQESGEMYLETILRLSQKSGHVRAIDVGEEMGYSKPSVSRAMSLLKQGEYIVIDKDGAITLTDAGREIAESIEGVLSRVGSSLTEEERQSFYRNLAVISGDLERICKGSKE